MAWTTTDLAEIGTAEELEVSSRRADGSLGSPRTIWVVTLGDRVFVRSVNGSTSAWFRGTTVRHQGHVRAGGVDAEVTFVGADHKVDDDLDAAYWKKYGHYAARILDRITSATARSTTLELVPA